ncbi:hypothetical protein AYM40_10220 [Paraburkholderia phytofirmans OLGA172]|uniref:Uncharacterized protein n=2 Tax=Paraburkholderia phytofirmans TaxID=261302 RepID=A0A160FK23_9BURK|nr:hypothetical protein AYM40_10220 [Paraburkholderia phytofirmans OLGA172]
MANQRPNLEFGGEMNERFRIAGLGAVDPHDNARAVRAWRWLQWVLLGFSLLAIPAFYFKLAVDLPLRDRRYVSLDSYQSARREPA